MQQPPFEKESHPWIPEGYIRGGDDQGTARLDQGFKVAYVLPGILDMFNHLYSNGELILYGFQSFILL